MSLNVVSKRIHDFLTKGLLDVVRCEFGIRLVFQHSHCTFPQTCNAVEDIGILFTILQVQHILIKRVLCPR